MVIIAIFFFLFPAFVFVATESTKPFKLPRLLASRLLLLASFLYRSPAYTKATKGIILLSTLYLLFSLSKLWYADTIFSQGEKALDSGNSGMAYNLLLLASDLNKGEPFYASELALAAAASAAALADSDAILSARLKDEAITQTNQVLRNSPKNVSFFRTAVRTYFELAVLDKKYLDETIKALDKTITLAPTDPKLYYNKALILNSMGKKDEEVEALKQALKLKPNYLEASVQLKESTSPAQPK